MNNNQPYYKSDTASQLLKIIFSKLKKDVTLATIVDYEDTNTIEMKDFILHMSHLSKYIRTEVYEKGENPEAKILLHADKFPVLTLFETENYYSGIKFHGIPDQYALIAFALTVYNLAGEGETINTKTAKKIISIDKSINIKVCMSPSCIHSADAIVAAQRLALLNPKIEAEALDLNLFPDYKNNYGIKSTPALIINNHDLYYGIDNIEKILDIL